MLSRKHPPHKSKEPRAGALFSLSDLQPEVIKARDILHKRGWSYRSAATKIGVHHMHLTHVLTGKRISRSLCDRIQQLPIKEVA